MEGDGSTVDTSVISDSDSSDLGVLPTEKYLEYDFCDFRDIRNSRIDELNLEKCKVLDIRDSWIRSLHAEHLACLVKLLADFSRLASLDTGPLQQLKELSLQGCPIEELQTAGLSQLTLLNVSSTKIRAFELEPMRYLEVLAIENTEIKLPENADLSRLRDLNVAGTKLETLNTMQLKELRNLNMNNCKIEKLDTTYLVLIEELLIGTNQLSYLDLAPMPLLRVLLVGKTCLTALDTNQARKLYVLDLSFSYIDKLVLPGGISGVYPQVQAGYEADRDANLQLSGHMGKAAAPYTPLPTVSTAANLHSKEVYPEQNRPALQADSPNSTPANPAYLKSYKCLPAPTGPSILLQLNLESVRINILNTTCLTRLEELGITRTQIKHIDLRPMQQLYVFRAYQTAIKAIDLTYCKCLSYLNIGYSKIARIDVFCVSKITLLGISKNYIKFLDRKNLLLTCQLNTTEVQFTK